MKFAQSIRSRPRWQVLSMSNTRALRFLLVASFSFSDAASLTSVVLSRMGTEWGRQADQWAEVHGTQIARQQAQADNEDAAKKVQAALSKGPQRQGRCSRFVLLTTQKTGGSWLMNELSRAMPSRLRTGLDAFNWRDGQPGNLMLHMAGFVSSYQGEEKRHDVMKRLGPRIWAEQAWGIIENATHRKNKSGLEQLESSCASGFKLMGSDVDLWSADELSDILHDTTVKKIILERENTHDQYLSRQWTCMVRFSDKSREEGFDWKAWTQQQIDAGNGCQTGHGSDEKDLQSYNRRLYGKWRKQLLATHQVWLDLKTENLPHALEDSTLVDQIKAFLFQEQSSAIGGTGEEASECYDVDPPKEWMNPSCVQQLLYTTNCALRKKGDIKDGYCSKTCGLCSEGKSVQMVSKKTKAHGKKLSSKRRATHILKQMAREGKQAHTSSDSKKDARETVDGIYSQADRGAEENIDAENESPRKEAPHVAMKQPTDVASQGHIFAAQHPLTPTDARRKQSVLQSVLERLYTNSDKQSKHKRPRKTKAS